MGIVRFALRFPYTFYVLAALILFLGIVAMRATPTDIFPEIRIPVVSVIWSYTGLSTPEMEQRVTTYSQYSISANVNGIRNIEAQSMNGLSVQKIFFQPDVNLDLAIAQIVAATNAIRALMPPGIQPPIVVQFNASSVPVLQISLSSDTLNEQQLYDYGIYRMRQQLAPIAGITLPTPAGGKYRQIMVDIDPAKLVAKGLTPLDVANAVNAQNLTLPSGTAKIGDKQYTVRTNATPFSVDDLNNIPIKVVNGATIFVKDVGQVHDGWLVQQNVVRQNGRRSVLLSIIKNGNASTLAAVNAVHEALKTARAAAPAGLEINELFDQSIFVRQSITGVLREGAIAAGLTAMMILLFLGSWRSTVVVMISIPLAILTSLVLLYFLGETLNTMTLGGLALAVGILVDDSTVTIENTHRLLTEEQMPLPAASWTDPTSGIPYYLAVQTPERSVSSLSDLGNTPVSSGIASGGIPDVPVPGLLSNVATLKRDSVPTNANQTNIQPVYEIYASVQGRDLGSVSSQISKIVADLQKQLSPGNSIQVIGQIQSMNDAFWNLGIGLLFAAVFVYLLMVVNYQNFGDPFVVILALPATLCGILTMLFITGTTLNVPSLMGAIMAVGVASANSILLVTFAREQQLAGKTAFESAIEAGHTRIRPVLMTAAAMIVGMIPMAIGGAGEEQNAALARAVIGGLLFATPTTLLIVPYLFAVLRKGNDGKAAHGVFDEALE